MTLKVLYVGGANVGKTSIISRIMGRPFPKDYVKTTIVEMSFIKVSSQMCCLWDVSSDVTTCEHDIASYLFSNVDIVYVVVDGGSKTSLIDADHWIKLLHKYNVAVEKTSLLVNKADSNDLVVTQDSLDTFVSLGGCSNWYWTVAHMSFRDYCPRRGSIDHQDPPLDILIRYVREAVKVPTPDVVDQVIDKCSKYRVDRQDEADIVKDEGWEFFSGIMSQQEAESILQDRISGSFLIRRSDLNYKTTIVVKDDEAKVSHIPLTMVEGKYRVSNSGDFEFLSDAIDSLGLNMIDGIRFSLAKAMSSLASGC